MPATKEDAQLILRLYELRREAVMRQARNWFARDFHPTSADDIAAVLRGEHSAYLRMVTTYWEMAAALVLHGTIDMDLFNDCNGEHVFIYAKLQPYLAKLRELVKAPNMCGKLEELVNKRPGGAQLVKAMQERQAGMAAARAR